MRTTLILFVFTSLLVLFMPRPQTSEQRYQEALKNASDAIALYYQDPSPEHEALVNRTDAELGEAVAKADSDNPLNGDIRGM